MKRFQVLLAATALVTIADSAHAQIIVNDPPALIKDALTAANTLATVNGLVHGNTFGSLVPGLGSQLATNPLSGTNPVALMSGQGGAGGLSSLFNQFSGQATGGIQITGNDANAQLLRQRAQADAGQMAVAQQMVNSGSQRLSLLPQLTGAAGGTGDTKASLDAIARINSEQATSQTQATQLDALRLYQQAQIQNQQTQVQLAYRKCAEGLTTSSQNAANAAAGGTVQLVNN